MGGGGGVPGADMSGGGGVPGVPGGDMRGGGGDGADAFDDVPAYCSVARVRADAFAASDWMSIALLNQSLRRGAFSSIRNLSFSTICSLFIWMKYSGIPLGFAIIMCNFSRWCILR